jgi:ribosomal subunit interface protein
MRLELTGRHIDITPGLRRLADARLVKLDRLLNDRAISAQIVFTREKNRYRADATLHARGEKFLHGVGAATTCEAALTYAIGKLLHQADKVKGKWQARKRQATRVVPTGGEAPMAIGVKPVRPAGAARVRARQAHVKTIRQAIKPMTVEAALQELSAGGDGVVVFSDPRTAAISVLYRREGELTLVETEA